MHLIKKYFFCIMLISIFSQILPSDGNFKRKADIEKSEESPIKKRKTSHTCNFGSCNEAFESAFYLACHQRDMHGAKVDCDDLKDRESKSSLFCKICDKTMSNIKQQSELKLHVENSHAFCVLCDEVCPAAQGTANSLVLFNHMAIAHPETIMALGAEE